MNFLQFFTICALMIFSCYSSSVFSAEVGRVYTTGLLSKDYIAIHSVPDRTLKGVVCHVTEVELTWSIQDNPTDSSISCRQTAKCIVGDYKRDAKDVFSFKKGIFFKKTTVSRVYDKSSDSLIYIAYTKKMKGTNAAHSISTVPLYHQKLNGCNQ